MYPKDKGEGESVNFWHRTIWLTLAIDSHTLQIAMGHHDGDATNSANTGSNPPSGAIENHLEFVGRPVDSHLL